jgi:hypothetical protein
MSNDFRAAKPSTETSISVLPNFLFSIIPLDFITRKQNKLSLRARKVCPLVNQFGFGGNNLFAGVDNFADGSERSGFVENRAHEITLNSKLVEPLPAPSDAESRSPSPIEQSCNITAVRRAQRIVIVGR